jgi:hypothetical protein
MDPFFKLPPVAYLGIFSNIFILVVASVLFKHLHREYKPIIPLFAVYVLVEISSIVLILKFGITNNLPMFHAVTLAQMIFVSAMFYMIHQERAHKNIIAGVGLAYLAGWIISKFTFEPFSQHDTITAPIAGGILCIYSVLTAIKFDLFRFKKGMTADPRLWFVYAVFVYFMGTLVPYAIIGDLLNSNIEEFIKWFFPGWGVTILSNLLFTGGLLCQWR